MEQVSEVEMLRYQVAELKAAFGQDEKRNVYAKAFGMTDLECRFMALLMAREIVSRETFNVAIYSDRADPPHPHLPDVLLRLMRPKVLPHGVEIPNRYGIGWYISPEHKKLVKELCA